MIRGLARHLSIVSGLSGAFAAAIPALLLWPRLGRSLGLDPLLRYYLVEMMAIGALVLGVVLVRASTAAPVAWTTAGAATAFAVMSGVTVGSLFAPACALLALSGLLADISQGRVPLRRLAAAGAAAALQTGVMVALAAWSA